MNNNIWRNSGNLERQIYWPGSSEEEHLAVTEKVGLSECLGVAIVY